jgi:predicted RNase H-like nuclease (RuvC/YqgF family)
MEMKDQSSSPNEQSKEGSTQKAMSFLERKEMNKLEKEITKLTSQLKELEAQLAEKSLAHAGYSVLAELGGRVDVLKSQLEEEESAWLTLAERAGDV